MQTVYVVQKLHWEYNDNWSELVDDEPLKAFKSRQAAEAYHDELEHQRWCQTIGYALDIEWTGATMFGQPIDEIYRYRNQRATSLTEQELIEKLQTAGMPLPPKNPYEWQWGTLHWKNREWGQRFAEHLKLHPEQKLWKVWDRVDFYEVVAIEVES